MRTPVYHSTIVHICDCKHLTVDDIFQLTKEIHPKIGYSTVYRNVEELVTLGKLRKIQGIGSKALFEKVGESHFVHFVDVNTGEVYDIPFSREIIESSLPDGFVFQDADLRIFGITRKPGDYFKIKNIHYTVRDISYHNILYATTGNYSRVHAIDVSPRMSRYFKI